LGGFLIRMKGSREDLGGTNELNLSAGRGSRKGKGPWGVRKKIQEVEEEKGNWTSEKEGEGGNKTNGNTSIK